MRRSLLTYSFSCIIVSLVGCGDPAAGSGGPDVTGTPSSDITGTLIDTHVTNTGDVQRVHDASTASVAVEVTGDDGNVTRIEGTVKDDGTFVIPNVPEGTYYIEKTSTRVDGTTSKSDYITAQRSLDLGIVYAGRPDVAYLKKPTPLHIQLDGLLPGGLNAHNELWLSSAGAGVACDFYLGSSGTTAYVTTDFLQCGVFFDDPVPAIDATKGDRTFVTHLVERAAMPEDPLGEEYKSVDKVFEPASFTVVDGQEVTISGTFSDVPQKTLTLSINKDAFQSATGDVHPKAFLGGLTVIVESDVGGQARATRGTQQMLLQYLTLGLDDTAMDFQFGNPFPSGWSEHYSAYVNYRLPLQVPGNAGFVTATVFIGRSGPASSLSSMTFEPAITPPQDIRVNGQPAMEGLSGVGTTPTISWSAPNKGTAAGYQVYIYKLDPTISEYPLGVEVITTTETSWTLPPEIIRPDSYYFVRIRAQTSFNPQAPFKGDHWEQGFAEGLTGVIAP